MVGAGCRHQPRRELRVASAAKVPVVGSLGPSAVILHAVHAVCSCIWYGKLDELLRNARRVFIQDRQSTEGQATVADTVPAETMSARR